MSVEYDSATLCERKLLHWVNSLPLMKCLLVEKLSDLRFGDILLEIVKYVEELNGNMLNEDQSDHSNTRREIYLNPEALMERTRQVVKYVASHSQSDDGEAMFLANDLKCADKILQGNLTYLCGILSILKRLTEQRTKRVRKPTAEGYPALEWAQLQEKYRKLENISDQIDPKTQHYTSFPIQGHPSSLSSSSSSSSPLRSPGPVSNHLDTKGVLVNQEKYQRKKNKNRRIRIVGFSSDRFREETHDSVRTSDRSNTSENKHQKDRQPWNKSTKVIRPTTPNKWEQVPVEIPRTIATSSTSQFHRKMSDDVELNAPPPSLSVDDTVFLQEHLQSTLLTSIPGSEKPIPNKRIAFEVYNWIHSLGIRLPVDQLFKEKGVTSSNFAMKSAKIFEDGILLCQLAAILVSRYGRGNGFGTGGARGSINNVFKHRVRGVPEKPGMFVIQGCNLRPDQQAQKRHNVLLALETLKEHGFFNIKHLMEDGQAAWNCFRVSSEDSPGSSATDSVWAILSHIKSHVKLIEKQQQQQQGHGSIQIPPYTSEEADIEEEVENEQVKQSRQDSATFKPKVKAQKQMVNHDRRDQDVTFEFLSDSANTVQSSLINSNRKPYITSEQIQAVQRWLHLIPELSIRKIETHASSSLLQDPIRNGVLLCELVLHFQITSSMAYVKKPKTLRDIGENLTRAFGYLRQLKWFPSVYFVSTEAVAMGDPQITWGILWYLWQYVEQQKRRAVMASMVISPSISPATSPLAQVQQDPPPQPPAAACSTPQGEGEEPKAVEQLSSPRRQQEDQGLLTWMQSIGLLPIRKSVKTREVFLPTNLEEMRDWLQNGIIFAELEKFASTMKQGTQQQGQLLKCQAIHEDNRFLPKVKSARLVKQSMMSFHQLLKTRQDFQQINLLTSPKWCEEKILAGNLRVITGILREIKLYLDARQKEIKLTQQKQQRQERLKQQQRKRQEKEDQNKKTQLPRNVDGRQPSPFLLDVPASALVDEQSHFNTLVADSILRMPSREVDQQKFEILDDMEEDDIVPVQKSASSPDGEGSIVGESELVPLQPAPPPPLPSPSPSFSGLNLLSKQLRRPQRQQILPPTPISIPPFSSNTSMNQLGPSLSPVSTTAFIKVKSPVDSSRKCQHILHVLSPLSSSNDTNEVISRPSVSKSIKAMGQQQQQEQVEVRDPALTQVPQVASTTRKTSKETEEDYFSATASQDLLKWLRRLGIRLEHPDFLTDPTKNIEPLHEFQSGVLLCTIVQKVEFLRTIEGVCLKPQKKPNALYNISKALGILQQKKTMPLHLLRRKMDIYEGKRQVILPLLHQIRKAYGHHYGPVVPVVSSRGHAQPHHPIAMS